jgi:hypothetical protein
MELSVRYRANRRGTLVAWDLAVTGESIVSYVLAWWPALGVGTDLFLAGYITAIIWKR